MNHKHATAKNTPEPLPVRLRNSLALLAIFLGLFAQVVHTHKLPDTTRRDVAAYHAATPALDGLTDFCPLCIAMHSSHPVPGGGTVAAPAHRLRLVPMASPLTRSRVPGYSYFIRPPPAFLETP